MLKMMKNERNKYCTAAKYFYNKYIDMYCIIGTTYSASDMEDLVEMFENRDLLTEVDMPGYITEDYKGVEW